MKKAPLYETWEMNDFRELLDGIEKRYAVNCAYVWHDGYTDDGIITKSYTELAEDVKNLAAYLCAMGLEGKTVAVTGKNSYLWAVSYLAIGCGCGMIVPLDRDLRSDELSGLCTDAGCAALFYTSDMEEKIAAMENPRLLRLPLSCAETYFSRGAELRAEGSMSYENHTVDPDAPGVLL